MESPFSNMTVCGRQRRLPSWPPFAVLLAFVAVTLPLWSNVYLSPPDSASYFSIPRTLVIRQDLDLLDDYAALQFEVYLVYRTEAGRLSNDWPIGSGVAWTPAYLAAHLTALAAQSAGIEDARFRADGVSAIYKLLTSLFVALLGVGALALGMAMVEPHAGRRAAVGAALLVLLGTPVGFYFYMYGLMSHVTSMAAVAALLYLWNATRGAAGRTPGQWATLGVLAGAMAMVRPQDVAFLVVFLVELALEPPRGREAWRRYLAGVAVAGGGALVAFAPQAIFWQAVYGHALQVPKIEEMHWFAPRLLDTLFSDYHGLLSWSPVLALVPVGLAVLWRSDRTLAAALGVALLLQVWLNAANEIWWAGGSFGNRRFVNAGLPFVVALAMVIRGRWGRCLAPLAVLLAGWNFLLIALERGGRLTLDHYVPWDAAFFRGALAGLDPRFALPALMGDFAGFGWLARGLTMAGGLALAWYIAAHPGTSRRFARVALVAAVAWLVAAPLVVGGAALATRFNDPAEFNASVPRRNQSLFNGYYEYGYYLYRNARLGEAMDAYRKASELRPGFANPHRYMATIALEMGDLDFALEQSGIALDLQPDYPAALQIEGRTLEELARRHPERAASYAARWEERMSKAEAVRFPPAD